MDRAENRIGSGDPIESLEPQTIREQVRDRGLESIQPSKCVLANPDQDVDAQVGPPHHLRQLLGEPATARLIEEAFLELVQNDVEVASGIGRRFAEGICERVPRPTNGLDERPDRISGPGREDCDLRSIFAPETMSNARAENGTLADAARPVEHGDASRHQICRDDLALALATEKEEGVEIRIFERRETLVRGRRSRDDDAHATTAVVSAVSA